MLVVIYRDNSKTTLKGSLESCLKELYNKDIKDKIDTIIQSQANIVKITFKDGTQVIARLLKDISLEQSIMLNNQITKLFYKSIYFNNLCILN